MIKLIFVFIVNLTSLDHGASVKVFQIPCEDRCQDLRHRKAEKERVRKQGAALKVKYIEEAQGRENPGQVNPTIVRCLTIN